LPAPTTLSMRFPFRRALKRFRYNELNERGSPTGSEEVKEV
jgi:hypothetical protein